MKVRDISVRTIAGRAVALLLGVAIALAAAESGARILSGVLSLSPYMRYDDVTGWTARPGASKRHRDSRAGFDVVYHINDQGFRGRLHEQQKPKGVRRVVVLGDSNGFGWGISEDNHFAAILDKSSEDVEVINLSLSGYGTDQEYLRFIKEGIAFNPDVVILQVTQNDFSEIQYPFYNQKPKPQFLLTAAGDLSLSNVPVRSVGPMARAYDHNSLPLPFKEWLGWHSYAFTFLNEQYYAARHGSGSGESLLSPERPLSVESFQLFNRIVQELKAKLDEIHAKGFLVHASRELSANPLLKSSIPVIDLYPRFADWARSDSVGPWFKDGFHWNVAGHRLVADELLKLLSRESALK